MPRVPMCDGVPTGPAGGDGPLAPRSRIILLTGATGFVGRNLLPMLTASGHTVVAATRRNQSTVGAERVVAVGDINLVRDWTFALKGIDCVIHLAARAHRRAQVQTREKEIYFKTNVEATAVLADAARAAGVRHLIFMSSIAATASSSTGRAPLSPEDPNDPKTLYGRTKLAAEQALAEIGRRSPDMTIDIVRTPMIIGPMAPGNLQILAAALRSGLPLPLASIKNRRMFLTIDSLGLFIRTRLAAAKPGLQVFNVADPEVVSTPQLVGMLAEVMGVKPRLFSFPPVLLGLLLRLARRSDKANALLDDLEIDNTHAISTGWTPRASLKEALLGAFGEK